MTDLDIRSLDVDSEEAPALICRAFEADPLMRWVFDAGSEGYVDRLRAYARLGHAWHVAIGQPAVGAFVRGDLVGVQYAMDPDVQVSDEELEDFRGRLAADVGMPAASRFFGYHAEMEDVAPDQPMHVLALIAVDPSAQRQGVGSRLVRWLVERCRHDPVSTGIGLDTGTDANEAFYGSLGFTVVGRKSIGPVDERFMLWEKA